LQAIDLFWFSGDRIIEVRAFFNVDDYDAQLARGAEPQSSGALEASAG
jgi:hypothetical protein